MKKQPLEHRILRSGLVLALALSAWSTVPAQAADHEAGMMTKSKMKEHCEAMREQKKAMNEAVKAQDAELTEELAKMNGAPDDKKAVLMAAVVTRLVEQRMSRDAQNAKMDEAMMKHMMQHMQMGKKSMSQCPMMKGMKEMGDKSTDAHKDHQEERK